MASKSWRYIGLILLGVILFISLAIVWAFLDVIVLSLALAYLVYPLAKKLNRGNTTRSAKYMVTCMLSVLMVALPVLLFLVWGLNMTLQWFIENYSMMTSGEFFAGLKGSLDHLGMGIVSERLTNEVGKLLVNMGDIISVQALNPTWIMTLLVKFALFFVTTFYFVYEGPHIRGFLNKYVPKKEHFLQELIELFDKTCYGLFVGHFFTSVFIAIIAAVGFWLILQPTLIMLAFLTILMFIISFLPVIGPWLMYVPMGVGTMVMVPGGMTKGILLILYGVLFLTLVPDFYIRPKLVRRGIEIHPLLIILGFFGGPMIFGLKGFIIGPLVLGLAQAIVSLYVEKRHILKELIEHF